MGGMMGGNEPRQFGYMDGDRRVSALMDMINGGGAGRAGQRFEGGGLLSDIGNAMFRPYGFEERMGQVRPQARPMQAPMQAPMQQPMPPAMSPFERFGGQAPGSSPMADLSYGPPTRAMRAPPVDLVSQFLGELQTATPERKAMIVRNLSAMPGFQSPQAQETLRYLAGM